MIYSYIGVSTKKQDFIRQEQAIADFCEKNSLEVDCQFSDKITGKTFDRPEYNKMKEVATAGDTIIVEEIGRLGQSWDGIKREWQYFTNNNIKIVVIDTPMISQSVIDEDGKVDLDVKLIQNIMLELSCYIAEKEREKISRRTKEALLIKKQNGAKLGRQADEENAKKIVDLYEDG